MGIGGAALASAIGMVIQVLVAGTHFLSRKNKLKLIPPKHVASSVAQIIGNGIPSFFNEFANGFIVLLFNIQILKYCGESALPVYSVISNCVILFNSLFTGVGQSIQPIIATNFGGGKWDRIHKIRKMSLWTVCMMGLLFSMSGILFPVGVCSVFMNPDQEMKMIAQYEHLSVETVGLINECTSANFLIQEGEKEVNMCNGLRQLREEGREEGRENLIIQMLMKNSPKEVADFTGIPLEEILRIEQSKLTTV